MSKYDGAKLLPWSYSRLKDYERCAFYAWNAHVLKNKSPQGPQAARGVDIHQQAEWLVKGLTKKTPGITTEHRNNIVRAKGYQVVHAEYKFGVTKAWEPAEFFGPDVWGRGVMDLFLLGSTGVDAIDHKTGRKYPEHYDQLRSYVAAAGALQPQAPEYRAHIWYLDLPVSENATFVVKPKEVKLIQNDFASRIKRMGADKQMKPRENYLCRYCHLSRSKGGPCPIN